MLLVSALRGFRIHKLRYRLRSPPGAVLSVDAFQGDLAGVLMIGRRSKWLG